MKRHVHYETAFQNFLHQRQIPYVAVDEARRAMFRDSRLKNFDFIVYSAQHTNWLVDIKGRRWAPAATGRRRWENWVTQLDLDGLAQWQNVFGDGFRGLFVFAYQLAPDAAPPPEIVFSTQEHRYVFAGVPIDEYRRFARRRSARWGTVNLATCDFARLVRPVSDWL